MKALIALAATPLLLDSVAASCDDTPSDASVVKTLIISDVLTNGTVTAEMNSSATTILDGPRLSGPANDTSYDWWYFDAVSASTNQSVVVVFYNSGPDGFINSYLNGPLSVSISGTFSNGSAYDLQVPASKAVIEYGQAGISAEWDGSGFSFNGSSLNESEVHYILSINSPDIGVEGTVDFRSLAPAHYPCNLNEAGVTEQIIPHVGWSNAVPDAKAAVNIVFGDDTTVSFTDGVGYHDKNWGDRPFVESTEQWYWGHAHLGPYSIVWFDAVDIAGSEYSSGYVAENGEILESSCAPQAVVVRPWGANDTYPPNLETGVMQGLEVQFELGDGAVFVANITTGTVVSDLEVYARTLGTVEGGVKGREIYEGRALFEEFKFIEASKSS